MTSSPSPDKSTVKSLVSVELKSLAKGYQFLNQLPAESTRILTAGSHAPSKFWLLFTSENDITELLNKNRKYFLDHAVIAAENQEILDSLFGQRKPEPLNGILGIVETKSVSRSLAIAEKIKSFSAKIFEIDSGRAQNGKSTIYFSLESEAARETIRKFLKKKIKKEIIDFSFVQPINPILKDYFQM